MNKKIIAIFAGLLVAGIFAFKSETLNAALSYGSVWAPVNQAGQVVNDADLVGRKYKKFANSTTETLVCSGPCVVDGVFITSGATTNYLVFADTTAVDGTGTSVYSKVYMPGSGVNSKPLSGMPPIETTIGLTIDASAADGFEAVVAYHLK